MTRVITLLLVLAAVGCGAADPKRDKARTINSPADAREAFRSQAGPILAKHSRQSAWDLEDEQKWSVRRQTFGKAWERVAGTLTPKARETQIVHGTLDEVRRKEGACWTVEYLAEFKDAVVGYIDPRTGRLIFLWLPPEG